MRILVRWNTIWIYVLKVVIILFLVIYVIFDFKVNLNYFIINDFFIIDLLSKNKRIRLWNEDIVIEDRV